MQCCSPCSIFLFYGTSLRFAGHLPEHYFAVGAGFGASAACGWCCSRQEILMLLTRPPKLLSSARNRVRAQPNHDKIPSRAGFPYKAEIVQGTQPQKFKNLLKGFSNLALRFFAVLSFFFRQSANLERHLVVSTPSSSPPANVHARESSLS